MLRRTRFFLFGAIVATPLAAITSLIASVVVLTLCSDEEYEDAEKYMRTLREI